MNVEIIQVLLYFCNNFKEKTLFVLCTSLMYPNEMMRFIISRASKTFRNTSDNLHFNVFVRKEWNGKPLVPSRFAMFTRRAIKNFTLHRVNYIKPCVSLLTQCWLIEHSSSSHCSPHHISRFDIVQIHTLARLISPSRYFLFFFFFYLVI